MLQHSKGDDNVWTSRGTSLKKIAQPRGALQALQAPRLMTGWHLLLQNLGHSATNILNKIKMYI